MTTAEWFFGYGSLVNCKTHDYPHPEPAELGGWRRIWVQTKTNNVCFLSAHQSGDDTIQGLIARVPDNNWDKLDQREHSYIRHRIPHLITSRIKPDDVQVYAVPTDTHEITNIKKPILLSYLDVVLSGYEYVYGREGVARFIASTDGWERPVLDDRAAPLYPRFQNLTASQRQLIDDHLNDLGCDILSLSSLRF